jgi:predicted alpha/beta hydrolase family esterase
VTQMEKKQVLFIHGGGDGGHDADAKLAASLQEALGATYNVRYPQMHDEDTPDFGWGKQIGEEISAIKGEIILVGHSLGASMLLKFLSENKVHNQIGGLFLISTLFWSGDEKWKKGLMLRENFADTLPRHIPIFLYHSRDDEEVDVAHLTMYAEKLPRANIREVASGGHQFGNDLTQVALDIKNLQERGT